MNALRLMIATLAASLASTFAMSPHAHADARRAGLAGSLLIEDRDDSYIFPERLLLHTNIIELTYGAAGNTGQGLVTFGGDHSVFGIAVHRGDTQAPLALTNANALGGPGSLFSAPLTVAPATIVDLLYAARLGGGELGARVALGHGSDTTTAAGRDSGQSDTLILAQLGYGFGERGNSTRVDLSGALSVDLGSAETAGSDTASGTFLGLSGLMRAFFPLDHTLDIGVLANVGVSRSSLAMDILPGNPAQTQLLVNVGGGVGPALSFGRVQVAAYGIVNVRIDNQDPNDDVSSDDSTTHTIVLPGVHMAVEVPLSDWFFVRSGAQYTFSLNGVSQPQDTGRSQSTGAFGWNAGLGVVIDQFRFDGSLQQGFVTGGPDFIGGTGAGFLALATLSYSFDHLRRNAPEVAPKFAPPPAPVPPPEPPSADTASEQPSSSP